MSAITTYRDPGDDGPNRRKLGAVSRWIYEGQITRHTAETEVRARLVANEAQLGAVRSQAVEHVANGALESQVRLSETEAMLSQLVPVARDRLAYLNDRATFGLGQVIDETTREVTQCRGRCAE